MKTNCNNGISVKKLETSKPHKSVLLKQESLRLLCVLEEHDVLFITWSHFAHFYTCALLCNKTVFAHNTLGCSYFFKM